MKELEDRIRAEFTSRFKGQPLCIFSPGRINLIGEHVDYNDGFVFPAAIDKGIYAAFGEANRSSELVALDLDEEHEFSTAEISRQPLGSWKNYVLGVVEEIKKTGRAVPDFNMVFSGDIPGGAGLSSSAALENCVAYGLNELFGLGIEKEELILISQRAEHHFVGVKCGIMDQFASMFGQRNKALLLDCRKMTFSAFDLPLDKVELLLIDTRVKHSLAESAYNKRRAVCERTAELLGLPALRDADLEDLNGVRSQVNREEYLMAEYVIEEIRRVQQAASCLESGDLGSFGQLMFDTHEGLSKKYQVSCAELDFLVDLAKKQTGVLGSRLMGGGFGGCTINLIETGKRLAFVAEVKHAYQERFDKTCAFYEVSIGNGTSVLDSARNLSEG